jgi:hypothetical protein
VAVNTVYRSSCWLTCWHSRLSRQLNLPVNGTGLKNRGSGIFYKICYLRCLFALNYIFWILIHYWKYFWKLLQKFRKLYIKKR